MITSNRTREIHDALKRRCLYHWVDYPNAERELATRTLANEDPEESAMNRLVRDRVRAEVQRLSRDQREVILLRLSGGLTSPEIAKIVGKTTGAVKALQRRGLAAVRRQMEREGVPL